MAIILVVEDEMFTREVAGMSLEDQGHSVLFADSVETAMLVLKSNLPIDALFTDVYLNTAIFGGCDVATLAKAIRPGLRVLYTTGNCATEQLKSMFVTGSHFLGKPYTPNQLHASIDGMLAS
ncbi:MAG: response regulator [Hyphomonadaceae bacterium]